MGDIEHYSLGLSYNLDRTATLHLPKDLANALWLVAGFQLLLPFN